MWSNCGVEERDNYAMQTNHNGDYKLKCPVLVLMMGGTDVLPLMIKQQKRREERHHQ